MKKKFIFTTWCADNDDSGNKVFERIIGEVDGTSVMFKKEEGYIVYSKDEDGLIDSQYWVTNSKYLNEMSICDFDLDEVQDFYKCLKGIKNENK